MPGNVQGAPGLLQGAQGRGERTRGALWGWAVLTRTGEGGSILGGMVMCKGLKQEEPPPSRDPRIEPGQSRGHRTPRGGHAVGDPVGDPLGPGSMNYMMFPEGGNKLGSRAPPTSPHYYQKPF